MILIVASNKDVAGKNIAKHVLKNYPFAKTIQTFQESPIYTAQINEKHINLIRLKKETVYAQNLLDSFPDPELLVFLSRHSSQSGTPTLSVHTPGNFAEAKLGGLPRTLSVCPAAAMSNALKSLHQFKMEMDLDYEVSYECTHHGPSLNVPTMFVELGSSPQQWSDAKAAEAVAKAAVQAIANFSAPKEPAALGIGGTHYNQKFTKMALNDEALFGHMIPKYALPELDVEILHQCVNRTLEKIDQAILDWKGIKSQDKTKLLKMLEALELPHQKI
jgi:D-aminoacyl-tRNA deacylase